MGAPLSLDGAEKVADVIDGLADNVARHRKPSRIAVRANGCVFHQDTPPNVLTCDHD
jgi:hypothetical protein